MNTFIYHLNKTNQHKCIAYFYIIINTQQQLLGVMQKAHLLHSHRNMLVTFIIHTYTVTDTYKLQKHSKLDIIENTLQTSNNTLLCRHHYNFTLKMFKMYSSADILFDEHIILSMLHHAFSFRCFTLATLIS